MSHEQECAYLYSQALQELVACKNLKDWIDAAPHSADRERTIAEYNRRKSLAWANARALLNALPLAAIKGETKQMSEPGADAVIAKIIEDISGRRGLGDAWESIDVDIRNEIVAEWRTFFQPAAPLQQETDKDGVYGASRVKHAGMWKTLRHNGHAINSSWIDEAGDGETGDFSELWERIRSEIASSALLVLYVEPDDFPLKGALIECGMAMALGVPVVVCAPQVIVEGRTMRPLGSWILSGRVKRIDVLEDAIAALPRRTE